MTYPVRLPVSLSCDGRPTFVSAAGTARAVPDP